MKELFPGHFKEDDKKLKEIWDTNLFVFDANILLNLYRYSDTTRNEFLRILDKIKSRIWIPYRAAEEFLNNRLSVIDQQEKSYEETVNSINSLRSDLDNARQHPFVSKTTMVRANKVFDSLCEELMKNKGIHTGRISKDEIKISISLLFNNKVGLPYDNEKLEKIIVDGEERYRQKIPPGYKDGTKSGDNEVFSEKCRKFGDLIVWQQIIDKSIESNLGVILVTDDKKEDWWEKFKGKTIGARPELIKEFRDRTSNTFHMYQADRFLELASENLDEQVSDEIVEEVRDVRRRSVLAKSKSRDEEYEKHVSEMEYLREKSIDLDQHLMSLAHKRKALEEQLVRHRLKSNELSIREKTGMDGKGRPDIELNQLREHYGMLRHQENQLMEEINNVSQHYNNLKQYSKSMTYEFAHLTGSAGPYEQEESDL